MPCNILSLRQTDARRDKTAKEEPHLLQDVVSSIHKINFLDTNKDVLEFICTFSKLPGYRTAGNALVYTTIMQYLNNQGIVFLENKDNVAELFFSIIPDSAGIINQNFFFISLRKSYMGNTRVIC